MAKTFVSPGVFTNEIDASYLPQGVGAIGAALIGMAQQGPAFVPIKVQNYNDYAAMFGDLNPDYPMGYAARAYLKNSSTANIVRVLGPSGRTVNGAAVAAGYTEESMFAIIDTGTDTVMALIAAKTGAALTASTAGGNACYLTSSNVMWMTGAGFPTDVKQGITCSFVSSSANYIGKVLNTDPTLFNEKGYYLKSVYDFNFGRLSATPVFSASITGLSNFATGFDGAHSEWVQSQYFAGQVYNLFKVHTLGHGNFENGRFKISISNISAAPAGSANPYGRFTLEVRSFDDTDKSRIVWESFPDVDLNPASTNYILRRIGDRYWAYSATKDKMESFGNYSNVSKYIRIEMATTAIPVDALPWGYVGIHKPSYTDANVATNCFVDLPLVSNLKDKESQAESKSYIYWGMETQKSGSLKAALDYLPSATQNDASFSLNWVSGSTESTLAYDTGCLSATRKSPASALSWTGLPPAYAKFTFPLAFGFDGFNVKLANPIDSDSQLTAVTTLGTQALRQAIDIIKDPDFIDINLLAIPGVYSNYVVDYGIEKIEERADALYVIELSGGDVTTVTTNVQNRGLNSSYAALYYPPVKAVDPVNNTLVVLNTSTVAIGAMAYTDRVSYPWFAPAGLNRGGLNSDTIGFTVTEATDRLTATERDNLYSNRVNPIASFPSEGVVVWGQKTLQLKASALDRVNVRRLLIRAKKLIASASKYLVFEPNNPATWTRFKQLVNPILQDIQLKNGLEKFLVVMDETTNTPDTIDRNIMSGKIFLVPTRAAEFITIDFVVSRTGASFSE